MAYPPPPPQNPPYGHSYYPPNPGQSPYPPTIGFPNFVTGEPSGLNNQVRPAYPDDSVRYHGEPEIVEQPEVARPSNNPPQVGFEGFIRTRDAQKPSSSGKSTSDVELLETVEDIENVRLEDEGPRPNRSARDELANSPKPLYFRDGRRKIDYILAYQEQVDKTEEWQEKRTEKRKTFQENLEEQGLELEQEDFEASQDNKTFYVKIHAPWEVLANGAEENMMRMPTIENANETKGFIDTFFGCIGITSPFDISEDEVPAQCNYFTCAFKKSQLDSFKGKDNLETFFSSSQRSEIVYRILKSTYYDEQNLKMGVDKLVTNMSYTAVFPLHEGYHKHLSDSDGDKTDRQTLYNVWGQFRNIYKKQPLNLIRRYFGEKIGMYFAWIGFYTILLFPAAVVGVINVIYGLANLSDYTPANIICDKTLAKKYAMCPRCDKKCDYFPLSETCDYARLAYVFDNEFTVVFAVFMSLWSTMFLEFWKRRQVEIAYQWDLLGFEDEVENIRPEFEAVCEELRNNPITEVQEPYYPKAFKCPRFCCSATSVLLMICLVVGSVIGVIIYRVAVFASLAAAYDSNISTISLTVTATAAVINLIIILLLTVVYQKLAYILTDMELPRTQSNYDDSFTIKMYLFQFVNYYSSLFYIGFAKLNPGRPGDFNRLFGYRQEECNAAGCLVELTIQLAIIMVGKQIFNASMEIIIPKVTNWWNRRGNILKKFRGEELEVTETGPMSHLQWEADYYLTPIPRNALFYEYLEMVIQFGFITIFVAAFPLGPLFALLNNLVEIRLDAYKFITTYRRPRAARAEDIGIWYSILKGVAIFSVVVNGFVIAFVSEFIPRLYFKWGKDKGGNLEGYLETSLSCFDTRDYKDEKPKFNFSENFNTNSCGLNLDTCRYRGYRDNPLSLLLNPDGNSTNSYDYSKDYWHILSGKLFFVIAFLLIVFGLTALLAYIIPDRPKKLDNQIKREAFLAKNILRSDRGILAK